MKQEMQMVWPAANRDRNEIRVLAYSGDVPPEARLKIFRDRLLPLLGAEYSVQMVFRQRMCHVSPLPPPATRKPRVSGTPFGASHLKPNTFPPLTRWATTYRRYRDYSLGYTLRKPSDGRDVFPFLLGRKAPRGFTRMNADQETQNRPRRQGDAEEIG